MEIVLFYDKPVKKGHPCRQYIATSLDDGLDMFKKCVSEIGSNKVQLFVDRVRVAIYVKGGIYDA